MNHLEGRLVVPFEALRMTDVDSVGGKNASLGEMISQLAATGVRVPGGFATTAHAFREFRAYNQLAERISGRLEGLNTEDVKALAECGADIRGWIESSPLPPALEREIREHYAALSEGAAGGVSVAVRSSATAEDLPDASFAGQQETFLNIVGLENIMHAIKEVFASLYNDRAISYRVHKGFVHADVALSAGKRSEVAWLNGAVVRAGRAANVPTPVNDALASILSAIAVAPETWPDWQGQPQRLAETI